MWSREPFRRRQAVWMHCPPPPLPPPSHSSCISVPCSHQIPGLPVGCVSLTHSRFYQKRKEGASYSIPNKWRSASSPPQPWREHLCLFYSQYWVSFLFLSSDGNILCQATATKGWSLDPTPSMLSQKTPHTPPQLRIDSVYRGYIGQD